VVVLNLLNLLNPQKRVRMTWGHAPSVGSGAAVEVLDTTLQPFSRFSTAVRHCAVVLFDLNLV